MLTELEQSTLVVQIKGSVQDSVWAPEFDTKCLKKAEMRVEVNSLNILIVVLGF